MRQFESGVHRADLILLRHDLRGLHVRPLRHAHLITVFSLSNKKELDEDGANIKTSSKSLLT